MGASELCEYRILVGTQRNYLYGKYTKKEDFFYLLPENFTNTFVNK